MTRPELEEIVRHMWPATYLVRATQTQDGWELELKSRGVTTHHGVDSNGHPTCHDTCADRGANLERHELHEKPQGPMANRPMDTPEDEFNALLAQGVDEIYRCWREAARLEGQTPWQAGTMPRAQLRAWIDANKTS